MCLKHCPYLVTVHRSALRHMWPGQLLSLLHYIDTVMEFLPQWNSGQCCWPVKAITESAFLIMHITLLANTVIMHITLLANTVKAGAGLQGCAPLERFLSKAMDELSMPFQKTSETGDYSLGVENGI